MDANASIASVEKSVDPDPQLSEAEEDDLWADIEDCCEDQERYLPQSGHSKGLLYPICIGDVIHHPEGRYQIVHRLGKGAYSVVWLALDSKHNTSVALKVMVAGADGEKEFANQRMLKEAANLDKSRLNLYQDSFLLASPYNTEDPPALLHRVLVLPLEGPSLSVGQMRFDRPLRSRMSAAKSLLQAVRDLHQAGFVHSGKYAPASCSVFLFPEGLGIPEITEVTTFSDINLGNVLWKLDPFFVEDITNNPVEALGAPNQRLRIEEAEGLKSGHRAMPPKFPLQRLGSQVTLADFGLLLADKTVVEYKMQGTSAFLAPERFHDHDPSPASDLWSFMVVFVYLYLGKVAFPNTTNLSGKIPSVYLRSIQENLGPLPAEWTTPRYNQAYYASSSNTQALNLYESEFATRLRENWQQDVTGSMNAYGAIAKKSGDQEYAEIAKRFEQELEVKKEAEPHALNVIHSIFRYQPEQRLTAEQLLESSDWIKLMELCGA